MLSALIVYADNWRLDVLGKEKPMGVAAAGCANCGATESAGGGKLLFCSGCRCADTFVTAERWAAGGLHWRSQIGGCASACQTLHNPCNGAHCIRVLQVCGILRAGLPAAALEDAQAVLLCIQAAAGGGGAGEGAAAGSGAGGGQQWHRS